MKKTVAGDQFVNVRITPSTDQAPLATLVNGTVVDSSASQTAGWDQVALNVGGAATSSYAYMASALLKAVSAPVPLPPVPIPPAQTRTPLLGVNVIGQADLAFEAAADGCRMFVIVDNPGACEKLARQYPDAWVINRRWSNWKLDGKQFFDHFGAAGQDIPNLLNEVWNEQDAWSYGTPKDLAYRIEQELIYRDLAAAMHCKTCAGAYSMGCPDTTNPDICNVIRTDFAPAYNKYPDLYLSFHHYSPTMGHILDDSGLIWYEQRYYSFLQKCDLDPTLAKIFVSETETDEGGVGGWQAHHATPAQVSTWCSRWQEVQSRPVVVNGVAHPTPLVGAAIFCYINGKDQSWLGYDSYSFRDILKTYYKK